MRNDSNILLRRRRILSVNMPDYDNVDDFVDDIICNNARWVTDTENGVSIQVDKIISICEVRDE